MGKYFINLRAKVLQQIVVVVSTKKILFILDCFAAILGITKTSLELSKNCFVLLKSCNPLYKFLVLSFDERQKKRAENMR